MKICLVNVKDIGTTLDLFKILPYHLFVLKELTPAKHSVEIIDRYVKGRLPDADLYGFTVCFSNANKVLNVARQLKKEGKLVIFGGPQFRSQKDITDDVRISCNSIVIGEAEVKWQSILTDFENGTQKEIYECRLIDMKNFPLLDRKQIPRRYFSNIILSSRGCPYQCAFCDCHSYVGKEVRTRPVEDVIQEIEHIEKHSRGFLRRLLFFTDINIIGNRPYAKELFRRMRGTRLRWFANCTINIAEDDELLNLAYESGCRGILIGYESIEKENLAYAKRQNLGLDFEECSKKIKAVGIGIHGNFMLGFDNDTYETFRRTEIFALDNLDSLMVTAVQAQPNTRFYDDLAQQNRLQGGSRFAPKNMSYNEVVQNAIKVHNRFYSFDNVIKRTAKITKGRDMKYKLMFFILQYVIKITHGRDIQRLATRPTLAG